MEFRKVERPIGVLSNDPLIVALIETVDTGEAIQVEVPRADLIKWQAKVRNTLRDLGYKMNYRAAKGSDALTLWAIKDPDA
jgi:hypothetical protein